MHNKINIGGNEIDCINHHSMDRNKALKSHYVFHSAKDGIFRQYKSPRDKESLISFVKEKKWQQLEPISSWKSPNSIQMSVISYFFKLSQILRVSVRTFILKRAAYQLSRVEGLV